MFIAYVVVASVLSFLLVVSGAGKLARQPKQVEGLTGLGVPLPWFPFLASAEILGAIGLIAGIWLPALGAAAAIGVILYFTGAVITHVRGGDTNFGPPSMLGLLAVAALVLRLLSI